MARQALARLSILWLVAAGCSSPPSAPPRAEPVQTGSHTSPAPAPNHAPGPGLGHVPVPQNQGHWSAAAATPEKTARLFALGPADRCECREVSASLVSSGPAVSLVRVRLEGLMDDSVRNMEYLVAVKREGNAWKVASATYLTECGRGVTESGLCV